MGNPFGKIIQNGVEYDVSPFTNKIEVKTKNNDTYRVVLNKMWTSLIAKVPDVTAIKSAKLVITTSDGLHLICYLNRVTSTAMYFTSEIAHGNGIDVRTFVVSSNSLYNSTWVEGSQFIHIDKSTSGVGITTIDELYYT